jgi:hypothetical protein
MEWERNETYIVIEDGEPVELSDGYLDHLMFCLRNPASPKDSTNLHQNCMGRYGGTIDPAVVLGGFMKPG